MEINLRFPGQANPDLYQKLIDAGISPLTESGGSRLHTDPDGVAEQGFTIIVPQADEQKVRDIVAAYDPALYKQAEDRRRARAAADRLVILNFAKSTTAPSPAQVLAFQKAVARDHLRVLGALRDEDDT